MLVSARARARPRPVPETAVCDDGGGGGGKSDQQDNAALKPLAPDECAARCRDKIMNNTHNATLPSCGLSSSGKCARIIHVLLAGGVEMSSSNRK